jgi:predicted esterase
MPPSEPPPAASESPRPSPLRGETPFRTVAGFLLRTPAGPPPKAGYPWLAALHGFGESAARFDALLAPLDGAPYARLVPDAPYPVEVDDAAGKRRIGRAWYQYDGDQARFLTALATAETYLDDVFAAAGRVAPLDPTRGVLLGYSQGGYLAGVAAFRRRARYRALVGVACRVKTEVLAAELAAAAGYPVLLVHGRRDAHTALAAQEAAHAALVAAGIEARLVVHEGGHGLKRESWPEIDAFVRAALALPPGDVP